ncbi:MAG: hypothetical protein WCO15_09350, partial [Actinomycetota bacterium]
FPKPQVACSIHAGGANEIGLWPFVPIGLPILASGLAIFVGLRPAVSSATTSATESNNETVQ